MRLRANRLAAAIVVTSLTLVIYGQYAVGAVEPIIETFDGQGDYASTDGTIVGLDNPEWRVIGDIELRDGGIAMENQGTGLFEDLSDEIFRPVVGLGSFVERIEIDQLYLEELCEFPACDGLEPPGSYGQLSVRRRMHLDGEGFNGFRLTIGEYPSTEENRWNGSISVTGTHTPGEGAFLPGLVRGTDIAIEMRYDEPSSAITIIYDHDVSDGLPGTAFGPFAYGGTRSLTSGTYLELSANGSGASNGIVDNWSILPLSDTTGDFDLNGILDAADIDQLTEQNRAATTDSLYDLNADGLVDDLDRQFWIRELKQTFFGDADLNGSFDSTDLVQVLASGEYEDGVELNSTWLTGDWDGDGDFTSGDLVTALADGGYEGGVASTLPEPARDVPAMAAAAFLAIRNRSRPKTRCQ